MGFLDFILKKYYNFFKVLFDLEKRSACEKNEWRSVKTIFLTKIENHYTVLKIFQIFVKILVVA